MIFNKTSLKPHRDTKKTKEKHKQQNETRKQQTTSKKHTLQTMTPQNLTKFIPYPPIKRKNSASQRLQICQAPGATTPEPSQAMVTVSHRQKWIRSKAPVVWGFERGRFLEVFFDTEKKQPSTMFTLLEVYVSSIFCQQCVCVCLLFFLFERNSSTVLTNNNLSHKVLSVVLLPPNHAQNIMLFCGFNSSQSQCE